MSTKSTVAVGAVLTVGIFASVLFAAGLATSPSLSLLDGTQFTIVKQAQIKILQVSMTLISTAYTVFAVWLLVIARKEKNTQVFRLTLIALLLIVAAILYSVPTDISYNQQILSWNPAAPPADWAGVRDAWDLSNRLRAVPSLLAFALQAIAMLSVNRDG